MEQEIQGIFSYSLENRKEQFSRSCVNNLRKLEHYGTQLFFLLLWMCTHYIQVETVILAEASYMLVS